MYISRTSRLACINSPARKLLPNSSKSTSFHGRQQNTRRVVFLQLAGRQRNKGNFVFCQERTWHVRDLTTVVTWKPNVLPSSPFVRMLGSKQRYGVLLREVRSSKVDAKVSCLSGHVTTWTVWKLWLCCALSRYGISTRFHPSDVALASSLSRLL